MYWQSVNFSELPLADKTGIKNLCHANTYFSYFWVITGLNTNFREKI